MRACRVCGKQIPSESRRPFYCGSDCAKEAANVRDRKFPEGDLTCEECGKVFQRASVGSPSRYCSDRCRWTAFNRRTSQQRHAKKDFAPRICEECKKEFVPKLRGYFVQRFCSRACNTKATHRRFIQKYPGGQKAYHLAHRYGPVAIEVFKRDKGICKLCGSARLLNLHHIDGSGQEKHPNNKPKNLIVLCKRCHGKAHIPHLVGIKGDTVVLRSTYLFRLGITKAKLRVEPNEESRSV